LVEGYQLGLLLRVEHPIELGAGLLQKLVSELPAIRQGQVS
jgi:hypothetical protein